MSVKVLRGGNARIRSRGTEVAERECVPRSFWDVLDSWGGKWIWELVEPKYRTGDLSWLDKGMKNGTLVRCADGSYRKKISPFVSSAGWVIHCTSSSNSIEGGVYEVSDSANAYRAKQLDIDAFHHLMAALSVFYGHKDWKSRGGCDSLGAIKITRRRLKGIRPSMKCADILRNIRTARNKMTAKPDYFHVFGHMDDWPRDDPDDAP